MSVLYNKKKTIPDVYKNPLNYDNIKIYIVVPDDPYDASIYGAFRDKRKAYKENLISQGIDKDLAEIMAKTFVDYEIVKPVVNGNC